MSELELKPCPFCGGIAKYSTHDVDIGGGDFQKLHWTKCQNDDCVIQPNAAVRGARGYRRKEDLTDEQAKQKSINAWNRRTPLASVQSVDPYGYVYEFDGPFGVHRSFSPDRRNGNGPSRTVKVYTTPQSAEDARDAALEEAARVCEVEGNRYTKYLVEEIRALKSKKEVQ